MRMPLGVKRGSIHAMPGAVRRWTVVGAAVAVLAIGFGGASAQAAPFVYVTNASCAKSPAATTGGVLGVSAPPAPTSYCETLSLFRFAT
jgi:hypothetical protein